MKILLTDEEIDNVFGSLSPTGKIDVPIKLEHLEKLALEIKRAVRVTNKAQLKKVVEWGDGCCDHPSSAGAQPRRKCSQCWQALKKEE